MICRSDVGHLSYSTKARSVYEVLVLVSCEDNRNHARVEKAPHIYDLLIGRIRASFHFYDCLIHVKAWGS